MSSVNWYSSQSHSHLGESIMRQLSSPSLMPAGSVSVFAEEREPVSVQPDPDHSCPTSTRLSNDRSTCREFGLATRSRNSSCDHSCIRWDSDSACTCGVFPVRRIWFSPLTARSSLSTDVSGTDIDVDTGALTRQRMQNSGKRSEQVTSTGI